MALDGLKTRKEGNLSVGDQPYNDIFWVARRKQDMAATQSGSKSK